MFLLPNFRLRLVIYCIPGSLSFPPPAVPSRAPANRAFIRTQDAWVGAKTTLWGKMSISGCGVLKPHLAIAGPTSSTENLYKGAGEKRRPLSLVTARTQARQLLFQTPESAVWQTLCSVCSRPRKLPSRFGDDHLRAQFVEFVPELLRFQATGDFSHLLAGDDGGGGDQWLGAQRGWGRAAAPAAELRMSLQAGELTQGLGAGRLLHELFWRQWEVRLTCCYLVNNRHFTKELGRVP